ncbi:MAG TPA: type II secretion system protein GspM, partial [Gallionella sp.]|nr:type II secretion system protein GspM [Gallionella sp.]
MMRYWEQACAKTDAMSMRERVMMFAAATFVTLYLMNTLLLQPLLAKQKSMTAQMAQQQQKTKELQAQMQALTQARNDDAHSPLRARQQQLKQELKA